MEGLNILSDLESLLDSPEWAQGCWLRGYLRFHPSPVAPYNIHAEDNRLDAWIEIYSKYWTSPKSKKVFQRENDFKDILKHVWNFKTDMYPQNGKNMENHQDSSQMETLSLITETMTKPDITRARAHDAIVHHLLTLTRTGAPTVTNQIPAEPNLHLHPRWRWSRTKDITQIVVYLWNVSGAVKRCYCLRDRKRNWECLSFGVLASLFVPQCVCDVWGRWVIPHVSFCVPRVFFFLSSLCPICLFSPISFSFFISSSLLFFAPVTFLSSAQCHPCFLLTPCFPDPCTHTHTLQLLGRWVFIGLSVSSI